MTLISDIIKIFAELGTKISETLMKIAVKQSQEASLDEITKEVGKIKVPIEAEAALTPIAVPPTTPEEVAKGIVPFFAETDVKYIAQAAALTGLSALGLGFIEEPLVQFLHVPAWNAVKANYAQLAAIWFGAQKEIFYKRYVMKQFVPMIPEEYRLAEQAAKGVLDYEKYLEAMSESGYDISWATSWLGAQFAFPTPDMCLTLLRRGIIDDSTFSLYMRRNQYPEWTSRQIRILKDVIPPIDDLIRFAVREAYPVETWKEQWAEVTKWAGKMGLTKYWSDIYTAAHWRRMDLAQAYLNLYWEYFDMDDLEHYLILADIHPDDRKAIKRVAYRVPTIREMGYGFDMQVYRWEDIFTFRKRGGLSPEDARKAADSLVAYRISAERESIRREYLWLYAHERMNEEDFRTALTNLETPPEALELWVWRGILQKERYMQPDVIEDYRIVTASEALWAFKHDLRDERWLRSKLNELMWTKERINLAVERAKAEIAEEAMEVEEAEFRALTVSQIRSLLSIGKIEAGQIPERLMALRYSPEDAELLSQMIQLDLAIKQLPKALTRGDIRQLYDMRSINQAEMSIEFQRMDYPPEYADDLAGSTALSVDLPDLRARYRNGWINEAQLFEAIWFIIDDVDRAIELAETIIKAEQPERIMKERDLTKAEIVKGVKKGIITARQGQMLLEGLGYEEWEAMFILAIHLTVEAGSPMGYWELRQIVELKKSAMGEPYELISDEVLMLEKAIADKKKEIEKLKEQQATPEDIAAKTVELGDLEKQLRRVLQREQLA